MDRYILLGLLTIANVILIASAACPTTLCTCTPATVYTCNVKTDGISVANLQTILASADTDSATELTITKYLGTSLTSEMFKSAPKLTKLTIQDSPAVIAIEANAFKGLPGLTSLNILGMSMTTLPEVVFSPLKISLTGLMIINNAKLVSIPVKIFEGLTKLTTLELTDNPLTTLDASVFTGLTAIVDLTISKTSITTMPDTLFSPLKANLVKLLLIGNSKLATLPNIIFNGLTKLTKLELTDNPLTSFDASAFTGLAALVDLTISKTSITTMPETLFSPLKANRVKLLLIGNSKLATLPNNIFNGLTKLTKLELTDNPLTSLDASAFTGLTALVNLTISKTSITTMPETLFAPLKANLEQLLLTGNSKLAMLPEKIFLGLTKLTTLNLKDNAIKTFHAAMFNVIKTAAIDTTGNPVSCSCSRNIQDLIDFAKANTNLIIKCDTPSSEVNKELKSVKKADICPCPTTFCDCTESKYTCDKKAAGITEQELTTAILLTMWNTVNELVITNYQGATLKAETFKSAPTIKTLAITSSPAVTGINANAFKETTSLSKLTISGTSVPTLPEGLFAPITATLVQLLITGNTKLAVLSDNVFVGLTNLTTLDLTNNAIRSFSAGLFNSVKQAKISASGNPVDCSCNSDISGLITWIKANPNVITTTIACDSPTLLKGKDLKTETMETVCPCPTTLCTCTGAKFTCDKVATGITETNLATAIIPKLTDFGGELKIVKYLGTTLKAEVFKSAPKIMKLSIDNSDALTTIDENAFKGMTALVALSISGTSVPTLPELVFSPIKGTLTELIIKSNTKLTALHEKMLTGLTKLTQLDLTDNAMVSFTASLFNDVKQATIKTAGNPVDCSCNDDITGLIKWLTENPTANLAIKCTSPDGAVKDKFLKSLTRVDVCGPPPSPQSTTIKPDKSMIGGLPDWALVIIVACIGAAIMVTVGIFCQRDKRKHYDEQKRIAYDNEHGYDNSAYVS